MGDDEPSKYLYRELKILLGLLVALGRRGEPVDVLESLRLLHGDVSESEYSGHEDQSAHELIRLSPPATELDSLTVPGLGPGVPEDLKDKSGLCGEAMSITLSPKSGPLGMGSNPTLDVSVKRKGNNRHFSNDHLEDF